MPELPEVETTRRGIAPHLEGRRVVAVHVRQPRLRRPVPPTLAERLTGAPLQAVTRRAKYLLFRFPHGTLLLHLGMSGSLRVLEAPPPPGPHDHLDLVFEAGRTLRLHDPRRFGMVDWVEADAIHPWLRDLGPEPLDAAFDGDWLARRARGRRQAVKPFIMDARVVVGVGNIYASEALFRAGIHPRRAAGRISPARYRRLAEAIAAVLREAIAAGGTTLREFPSAEGRPGYLAQRLAVYGRAGAPCPRCARPIVKAVIGGRSSYYCPGCQR